MDTESISRNVAELKRFAGPQVKVMVMVKGNGYGHGTNIAARAAVEGGADWLGVATAYEALEVCEAGVPVLNVGWTPAELYGPMIEAGVDMAVFDGECLEGLAHAGRSVGRRPRIQVKIDTGMHRLGLPLTRVPEFARSLERVRPDVDTRGIFTHFACADAEDPEPTLAQHQRFMAAIGELRSIAPDALIHCSNTFAALRFPELHHDLVRFGIAVYGYPGDHVPARLCLSRALQVVTRVARVEAIAPGDRVGYGGDWVAERSTRTATICAGYADGVLRTQSGKGQVLIRGRRCRIVGRVSMCFATVDVGDLDSVCPGDDAVLLGEQEGADLGADELAEAAGTVPNDILCAIAQRAPRHTVS